MLSAVKNANKRSRGNTSVREYRSSISRRYKSIMNTRAAYKKKQHTYQTVLIDNVQMLANYIVDKQKALQFSVPSVQLKWDDDNATRDFILNMTPEQQKELGINKSTLWYIQNNLREGKKVKIYDKVKAKIL